MQLITNIFNFVLAMSSRHYIDESHGLMHSMNVVNFAHEIYNDEIFNYNKTFLIDQERIIYVSSILHDLCDRKYINENEGIEEIQHFLTDKLSNTEIDTIKKIITTMSYSKVKKNGYPMLGTYQHAYHIVREADLLSAYDFDRCMIYKIKKDNYNFIEAYDDARNLFFDRVLQHKEDNLFVTNYSNRKSLELHSQSLNRINNWNRLIKSKALK